VTPGSAPADPRALEALLAFWLDAGVDVALADAPVDRLARPPARALVDDIPRRAPGPAPRPLAPAPDAAARAAALAAASPDLAALRAAVEAFDGCALRQPGASRAVFAHLPSRTDFVVVAEAPAPEDEAAGAPFASPAGALVRTLLRHAGLEERALLTQTVFWRPALGAAPSAGDQAACRPFLERLIALARPRALLVMGDAASRGFLGLSDPILKARGRWSMWRGAHEPVELPALATLSPAFVLARPAMRKAVWSDILSLAARVAPSTPGG
jgi:DNA polymerase